MPHCHIGHVPASSQSLWPFPVLPHESAPAGFCTYLPPLALPAVQLHHPLPGRHHPRVACARMRKGVAVEVAVAADLKEMETKYPKEFERLKQSPCYIAAGEHVVRAAPLPLMANCNSSGTNRPPPLCTPSCPLPPSHAALGKLPPLQHDPHLQGLLGQGQRLLPT